MGDLQKIFERLSPEAGLYRLLSVNGVEEQEGITALAYKTGEDYSWIPKFKEERDPSRKMTHVPPDKRHLVAGWLRLSNHAREIASLPPDLLERMVRVYNPEM